ncbi:MAG: YtxH domain-containing protein [Deltaproteobacteria bacterium]|nr:YtxH domain-containing protein [Deltaproteobacteria bacterium]
MSIREIDRDDVLRSLGLQTRNTPQDYMLPALGVFGAGMLVGVGLGLFFAPSSGRELRRQVADQAQDVAERAQQVAERAKDAMPIPSHDSTNA